MAVHEDIARTLHATGLSLRAISERLSQLGHVQANGKPYHAAQVQRWLGPSTPKAKAPAPPVASAAPREPSPALPPDAPVEERLRARLRELDELRDEARREASYGPAVLAAKTAIALEAQIEAMRPAPPVEDPTAGMTDEEITARICAEVAGWDEDRCDAVEEAIAARRGIRGSGLQVFAGGRIGEAT